MGGAKSPDAPADHGDGMRRLITHGDRMHAPADHGDRMRRLITAKIQQSKYLATMQWQRMAQREGNDHLPSILLESKKVEHGAPLKRGASGRIVT